MAQEVDAELEEEEVPEEEQSSGASFFATTGSAPWWIVSVLLHVLLIVLASLVSMAIDMPKGEEAVVMVTEMQARPELKDPQEKPKVDSANVMASNHDTPATDP